MTSIDPRLVVVPHGPPARDALRGVVGAAKGGDPLAPVTVAPPSVWAGLSLRRGLAADGGLVNVRFMPLARVAELLGAGALAGEGRTPLTPAVRRAAVRAALATEPGLFAPVAGHPNTEEALDRTFAELLGLSEEGLGALAGSGERAGEVVRLFRAFRASVADRYSEPDVVRAAARRVAGDGEAALADIGVVVVHLPVAVGGAERELLAALAGAGHLAAVVGVTGDAEADEPARRMVETLAPLLGTPATGGAHAGATPPRPERIALLPDPEEELRFVARLALAAAESEARPLHRVAVVAPPGSPYATAARDVLGGAGVPFSGPVDGPLAQTVAGRVLLALLALPDSRFARHDVAGLLAAAPLGTAPVERWDRLSREAGVTAGPDVWSSRLGAHARRLLRRAGEHEAEGDAERAESARAAAAEAEALAAFVDGLVVRLRPPPGRSWPALAAWARGLLHHVLGGEGARAEWPEAEIEAAQAVDDVLDALGDLDPVDPDPTVARFRRALEAELDAPGPRTRRHGEGLFVGRVDDVVGTDLDTVAVVGMVEGTFPSRPAASSVLSERDREACPELPARAERVAGERHRFLAALMAARHVRVLTAPRTDPRRQRPVMPSRWLVESGRHLRGEPVRAADLPSLDEPWLTAPPSVLASLVSAPTPLSRQERDLRALLAGDTSCAPSRGWEAVAARRSGEATVWDGVVGPVGDELRERTLSPTALERWAVCPFRSFLSDVLRVRALADPEEIESLQPMDRGSLVHEVLERFMAERGPGTPPSRAWDGGDHDRLDEVLDACAAEFEEAGRTGRALLWELQLAAIRRELHQFLDRDSVLRADLGVTPHAFELPFDVEVGAGVRLHGYADRVDRSEDGTLVAVHDYKTGRPIAESAGRDPFEDDPVLRGTKMQLPAYALAARAAFGGERVQAHYWYVSGRHGFKREGYELTPEREERFRHVLGSVADGVGAGLFPARPGGETYDPLARRMTWEHCRTCEFDRVCPADREAAWERKAGDPTLAPYVELAEGGGDG